MPQCDPPGFAHILPRVLHLAMPHHICLMLTSGVRSLIPCHTKRSLLRVAMNTGPIPTTTLAKSKIGELCAKEGG